MDFRIRQLQCFLTLSDLLNYNKTARVLYMSQPTITFQIKSLEEAFGVKLFVRDRQQVRLTDAGVAFREYAQTIMDTVHSAHDCLSGLHTRMRLRVSCGPVGQFVLLPAVLRTLAQRYPEFELEVIELTTEQQITRLSEGKVDALVMIGALPVTGMRFDPICEDDLVAMVSDRSPLAKKNSISVEDLRVTPIIASRMKDCRFSSAVASRFDGAVWHYAEDRGVATVLHGAVCLCGCGRRACDRFEVDVDVHVPQHRGQALPGKAAAGADGPGFDECQ